MKDTTPRRWYGAGLVLIMLGAWLLYHPWQPLPLDVWDFREFLPILATEVGVVDRLSALIQYYEGHGRANILFYATFAVQYGWFGTEAVGWQLLRWLTMAGNLLLLAHVARRYGLGRGATLMVVGLLVTADGATRAWLQLMAEPQALLALLLATVLAREYPTRPTWVRRALSIHLLLAAVFLSKEVVGVLGVVVVVIALTAPGPLNWRQRLGQRRYQVLAAGALLVACGEALLLRDIRTAPAATGYSMTYGGGERAFEDGLVLFGNMSAVQQGSALAHFLTPVNGMVLLLLLLGLHRARVHGVPQRTIAWTILLGLLPAMLGTAAYWPWPKFDSFYALPFSIGPLLLLGAATHQALRSPPLVRALVTTLALAILVLSGVSASRGTEMAAASLRLNHAFATVVGRLTTQDTLIVVEPVGVRSLPVTAEEIRDYTVALGLTDRHTAPTAVMRPCESYRPGESIGAHRLLATYSYGCGRLPDPALRLVSHYRWLDLSTGSFRTDSLTLDLVGDRVATGANRTP